jgi:hypothetical protein
MFACSFFLRRTYIRCFCRSFNICLLVSRLRTVPPNSLTVYRPVSAYWTPNIGVCLNEGKVTLANGIVNTIADALTTALPIPMILRLKMRPMQKAGVISLLGLGFIVTIAGIFR